MHFRVLPTIAAAIFAATTTAVSAQDDPPMNFPIIWGDDIGYWNISAYNHGMMGYQTPNIDRIAKEGALFTDWYGEQVLISPTQVVQFDC